MTGSTWRKHAARSRRCATPSSSPAFPEDRGQQCGRALLVQRLVAVAALRRLDAGWAPPRARTLLDHLERRREPSVRRAIPALDDAGAAGVAVVDEDRAQAGVRMQRRGHAAHVPAV